MCLLWRASHFHRDESNVKLVTQSQSFPRWKKDIFMEPTINFDSEKGYILSGTTYLKNMEQEKNTNN